MNIKIGKYEAKFGKVTPPNVEKKTENRGVTQVKEYTFAPLRTALLPSPAELRTALNYVESDPRPMLDILRKLPQASNHLLGLMGKRQDAFLSLDYAIKPHRLNAENKDELRRCDEITDRLVNSNFDDVLKQIINSVMFGHSVTNPIWELNNHNQYKANFEVIDFIHFGKKNGLLKLIADKDDKEFMVTFAKDLRLFGSTEKNQASALMNNKERVLLLDINYDSLIVSSTNPFLGLQQNYIGGWMRPLLYLTLLLHYNILDWAHFNEMFGQPLRVGKYDTFAPDKAVEVLRNAVKNLGADASAIIDKTTEIEFIESKEKNSDGYLKFAEYVEAKQSVNLRGETLTTEVNSNGGNRALGEVHRLVGADKLLHDIKVAKPIVTNQIVKRDYSFNYGNPANGFYPEFHIYPKNQEDYQLGVDIVQGLASAGLPMSKAKIYEKFKEFISAPESDEDSFGGGKNPFELM